MIGIGLSPVIGPAYIWTPQRLRALSLNMQELVPLPSRVFTDAAATTAATFGDTVGGLRDGRGTIVATQATSGARPQYGRHPAGGIRNVLPNNRMDGAVVGVLGSGGAAPTGWTLSFAGGAAGSFEVVAVGADYIDIRIVQTASVGAPIVRFSQTGQFPSVQGDVWASSAGLALIDGDLAGNAIPQLRGTQVDDEGTSVAVLAFLDSVPITSTLTRYSGTATANNAGVVGINSDFRVSSLGPWTATFRISLPQLEQAAEASDVQNTGASGFDITETGQRDVYYLAPDGMDDFMNFASAFSASDGATVANAISGPADPVFGGTPAGVNARFIVSSSAGGRLSYRVDTTSNQIEADDARFLNRHVALVRISGSSSGGIWVNGDALTSTIAGSLLPTSHNAIFRFGTNYSKTRFYGGVLIDRAITEAERQMLQLYLASKGGIAL
jgi:hypothetical protein